MSGHQRHVNDINVAIARAAVVYVEVGVIAAILHKIVPGASHAGDIQHIGGPIAVSVRPGVAEGSQVAADNGAADRAAF